MDRKHRILPLLVVLVIAGMIVSAMAASALAAAAQVPSEVSDSDASTASTEEADATTERLGLHVTQEELDVWRQRTTEGPFRTEGDVTTNSPGDWSRIVDEKDSFMSSPSSALWAGPAGFRGISAGGCVAQGSAGGSADFLNPAFALNSAAFYAMVEQDGQVASQAASILAQQVDYKDTQFANRSRYCLDGGMLGDQVPGFMMSDWLATVLYAYDYLLVYERDTGDALFSDATKQEMLTWLNGAAEWFQARTEAKIEDNVVANGDEYSVTSQGSDNVSADPLYAGGPDIHQVAYHINNRNARVMRTAGIIGVFTGNTELLAENKQFWKELLMFAYFPEGAVSDFHRWEDNDPTHGWKYGTEMVGSMVAVADVLARAGDTELYEFETTEGALGSEGMHWSGVPKSIHTAVTDMAMYVSGDYKRYASSHAGNPADLISPSSGSTDRLTDLANVPSNQYFEENFLRDVYLRVIGVPFPDKETKSKSSSVRGDTGTVPGVLFMFGATEHLVSPYPATTDAGLMTADDSSGYPSSIGGGSSADPEFSSADPTETASDASAAVEEESSPARDESPSRKKKGNSRGNND